ncbi:MAG: hypothetical protein DHS20C16_12920 [Phycisphaerae bacterium]|nr:MAG: hypothetical protein DHS20C16_12920 [Phycisphaerae bacterium]
MAFAIGSNIANGQIATSLVNEGDEVDSNGFPGDNIGTINNVAVNSIGGWAATLNAGSLSHIYGSIDGVSPAGVIFTETTEGPLVQTSIESRFGISDFGDVCYSASGNGGPDGGFDSAWVNTIGFAIEGAEITTGPLAGLFWSFASAPTMTANGIGHFSGGTRTTVGGGTSARGIWGTDSETPIIYTGDELPGLPAPIDADSSIDFSYKFSRFGSAYILDGIMETTGTGLPSGADHAMIMDGAGLFLDGQLVQEGSVVPVAIGGDGTETWATGFDFSGISDMGEYLFTGDTSGPTATDEYLVLNGVIHLREGDALGADTISGAIEAADMNNNGDWAVVWQLSPGGTCLIYNDQVLLRLDEQVDFNGDGVIDGGDNGATVDDFEVFSNAMVVGDRDAAGNVSIYLPLDVDPDGPGGTTSLVEGIYQISVAEPAGPSGDLELVVVDGPDPQVNVPGDVTYSVKVRNNSDTAITGVTVTSTLDSGLTFDAGASDAIAVHAAGTVTANLGTIEANAVRTYKFVTNAPVAGIYTTTSSVTGGAVDSVPGNNDVTSETEVGKKADVSILITDAPDPLTVPGGAITYTLNVLNDGPSSATNVVVTMNLDPTTTFNAGLSDPAANHAAGVVTINVGSLANDEAVSFDVVVNVTVQGVINVDASITANESDEVPANNADTEDTLFQLTTDLVMTISDAPDPVLPVGGQITYAVSVDNDGPSDATGVTASVTLDDSVSVVSVDAPGIHDGSPTGGVVTYAIGAVGTGSNGLNATIVVDTTETGRPVCTGSTSGGGFETDPDPVNNNALVNTLVIDDASGLAVGVFSNFASSPTSDVPGLPGAKFGTGIDRPYRSPDGKTWVLSADTDLGTSVDEVIIVGNHCTSEVKIQEGVTTLDASDQVGPIEQDLSINDAGQFAFATNTNNSTSADETIVRSDGSTHVVIAREGNLSPATGGNFGSTLAASNIVSDNTVWFDADTTLSSSMDRFLLSKNGVIVEAQEEVTVPTGQAAGGTDPIKGFVTGSMRVDATGSNFTYIGDTNGDTSTDEMIVVNNQVVVQEGVVIAGSGFAAPADISLSTETFMFADGSWMARGSNQDGSDWLLRDGAVVSQTGDPIVAGAVETYDDASSSAGFFLFAQNNAGDYVIGSVTSATESASDAVLTINGEVLIAREGDPVDLDGNGIVDDGMRIRAFSNDDLILTEDLQAYVPITVRDFNDDGSNTDIGDVFIRFNLCGLAGPCGDLDNDKDVDGDDYDIFVSAFGSTTCDAEYSICADFDEDGVVTHVDFQQWLLCYRDFVGSPLASPPVTIMGDFDRDDDIDLNDFAEFQICAGAQSESIPCRARFDFNHDDVVTLLDAGGLADALDGPLVANN